MSDLWDEAQQRALLRAWATEIADAIGGVPDDEVRRVMIASIVLKRALLLDLDAFVRVCELREVPRGIRLQVAACALGMARYLRALGLKSGDVRGLDLGRRRRRGALEATTER